MRKRLTMVLPLVAGSALGFGIQTTSVSASGNRVASAALSRTEPTSEPRADPAAYVELVERHLRDMDAMMARWARLNDPTA